MMIDETGDQNKDAAEQEIVHFAYAEGASEKERQMQEIFCELDEYAPPRTE